MIGFNTRIESKPIEINHLRFYFAQIERYKKCLDNEQMGRLFFALYNYAVTDKKVDVDADILYPYEEGCRMIERFKSGC